MATLSSKERLVVTDDVLFHGSPVQGLKTLKPMRESNPMIESDSPPAVYAGITAAYSATFAFPGGSNHGVERGSESDNDPFTLTVPSELAHHLYGPASVYVLPANEFEVQPHIPPEGWNFRSLTPVNVLEELQFPTIRQAIEELGGKVVIRG
jgi:hypothetical protein